MKPKTKNKSMEFHERLEHRVGFLCFVSLIFPLVFGTFGQRHDQKTSQWWFMSGWDIGLLFWGWLRQVTVKVSKPNSCVL